MSMGQPSFVANPDPSGNGKVLITRLCNISITAAQNPICLGSTVTLSTDALFGITWFSGASSSFVNVSPSVTTTYSVTGTSTIMTGTGTTNCITSNFITVSVNPLPSLSIVAFPTVACSGGTAYLTGFGAASATSYSWSNGMNGTQVATVVPFANTIYTLTGTNNFGCSNTQTIQLQISNSSLTVNQSTTAVCSGQSATLTANGAVTYTWSNGLMFQSIPVTPTITTLYMVSGTDQDNCSITNSITLTVFNNPVVTITANKTNVCKGESITLTGSGANSYVWGTSEQAPSVVYTLPSDITYYYSVTGKDGNGCTSTANFSIAVSKCQGINEENNLGGTITVYPNPGTGRFNVSITEVKDHLNLKVYNTLGMLVKSQPVLVAESELDLENETSGIYFVNVCDRNSVVKTIRIIKN
jgi:hypothetical protein